MLVGVAGSGKSKVTKHLRLNKTRKPLADKSISISKLQKPRAAKREHADHITHYASTD